MITIKLNDMNRTLLMTTSINSMIALRITYIMLYFVMGSSTVVAGSLQLPTPEAQQRAENFIKSVAKGDFSSAYTYTASTSSYYSGEVQYRLDGMKSNAKITNKKEFIAISNRIFNKLFRNALLDNTTFSPDCCVHDKHYIGDGGNMSIIFNDEGTPYLIINKYSNINSNIVTEDAVTYKMHQISANYNECHNKFDGYLSTILPCYEVTLKDWDIALNLAYKEMMAISNKEQKDILRDAQRKWIMFRDSEIKLYNEAYKGGWETARMRRFEHEISLTRIRTNQIRTYLEEILDDNDHY